MTSSIVLPDDLERVEQRGAGDDRRAVLVVVEDRNPHRLAQRLLDVEAVRGADVLEVDAADRRLEQLAELDDVVGILRSDLDVEDVDVGELLEEICLCLPSPACRRARRCCRARAPRCRW